MRLGKFIVENYRSCVRTAIELQPDLTVLIGPNGSGKTNILQALLILNKIAKGRSYDLRHHVFVSKTPLPRIKADFTYRGWTISLDSRLTAKTDEENHDVIASSTDKWTLSQPKKEAKPFVLPIALLNEFSTYHFAALRGFRLSSAKFPTMAIPSTVMRSLRQVASYCAQIKYYGASQFTNPAACSASFEIEDGTHRLRSFRASNHTRILYDMYVAKSQQHPNYPDFMEIVGPKGLRLIDRLDFKTVPTSSIEYSVRVGGKLEERKRNKVLVIPHFTIGKQKLSPNQLSEGTFKTLALLFHVITEKASMVLIEEPEVCVHHGLLASILQIIKNAARHKQIIMSTHSDYVLDHVKPENVYRVSLDSLKGTHINHIPNTMTAAELAALKGYLASEGNLGDYWREGGLGDRN